MSRAVIRRLAGVVAILALLFAFPAVAAGTITGGCTGEGHATSGGADLTTATEWHMNSDDVAGGSGTAPAPVRAASVAAYALGIGLPIAGGTSEEGETAGSVDGIQVAFYAVLGKRFVVAGSATGDANCSGEIEIIIDDVNPLLTVLGGGGIILALLGLIAMLLFARGDGGCANRVASALFGGLGGVGAGLALEQFDVLDPTEPFGLVIVVAAAILGFVTAGMFGEKEPPAAPASGVGGTATVAASEAPLGARSTPDPGPLPDPGPHERPEPEQLPPGGRGGGGPM